MSADFDCIVVGSGPAGVSVAFPLLEAGRRVLMVDGGAQPEVALPEGQFLKSRTEDPEQWRWFAGDLSQRRSTIDSSPKLRVPTQQFSFRGYSERNRIRSTGFSVTGSLAVGGLSNAWGCGVAVPSGSQLAEFPVNPDELRESFETVSKRMGISGRSDDDLSEYFGVDAWAMSPVLMDDLHAHLLKRYSRRGPQSNNGFVLGRSRVAVVTEGTESQMSCDLSGNCLWGCSRGATYSAVQDLERLKRFPNFHYRSGFLAETLVKEGAATRIQGSCDNDKVSFTGNKVFIAAGTLATTAIVLRSLKLTRDFDLLSCPTAAFLLWLPRFTGSARTPAFGLGQLSFTLALAGNSKAFGSTFNTTGVPVSEFLRSVPFTRRAGIDLLRGLLSSCLAGNVFLPGCFSSSKLKLTAGGDLLIRGAYSTDTDETFEIVRKQLFAEFSCLGALMIPTSFTVAEPGSDIHYVGTLPMRSSPEPGETSPLGEVHGLGNVFAVDGSCLPILTEKSHTLTIMANADRIGRLVSRD